MATPPVAPGDATPPPDVRDPSPSHIVTNHGTTDLRQEVELQVASAENLGSMLELHPSCLEEGFKYRWVNRDPKKIMRAKARGYAFVRVTGHRKVVNIVGDSPDSTVEGFYMVGDVVLMRSQKALYLGRRKKLREKTEEKLGTPKKDFRRKARQEGKKRGQKIPVTGRFRQRNEPNERD